LTDSKGSFGIGFVLGLFAGLVGLIIALCCMKDQSETRRGAVVGFSVSIVMTVIFYVIYIGAIAALYY
jgi:small-conductance mechanosensitive channel